MSGGKNNARLNTNAKSHPYGMTTVDTRIADANREGTKDRRTELQGKLEVVDNQIQSTRQLLDSLREDAKEQADTDGIELTDAQLRNDG